MLESIATSSAVVEFCLLTLCINFVLQVCKSIWNFCFAGGNLANHPTYGPDPKLISTLQLDSIIRGVVVVKRELYVVTGKSSEVQVYDAVTFEFKSKFPVKGLTYLYGITATNQSLFISDYDDSRIYRIDMPERVVTSWQAGTSKSFNRLSITKQGNILVTMCDVNSLCEYSPSGSLIRTIQLPPEMHGPRHAIHLDEDRFLFSHEVDGSSHCVCIIENDGRLISTQITRHEHYYIVVTSDPSEPHQWATLHFNLTFMHVVFLTSLSNVR